MTIQLFASVDLHIVALCRLSSESYHFNYPSTLNLGSMKILLLIIASLITSVHSFYIFITDTTPQCFFSTIYQDERLLIEIQTPMISLAHKILLTVKNDNNTVLQRGVVNQIKITAPRPSNSITNQVTDKGLEYSSCLELVADDTTNKSVSQQMQSPIVQRNGYLLSVKLMINFEHKLQNVKQNQIQNIDYKELQSLSKDLLKLNSQQINMHQINEVKQKLSQTYLQTLKTRVIAYSTLQILMVVCFTCLQISIFKKYLSNISVV